MSVGAGQRPGRVFLAMREQVPRLLREQLPAAEVFASRLPRSETRPLSPESCGSSPPPRLLALARKLLPTVQRRSFFTWPSSLARLLSSTGGLQVSKNTL